jgi:hypothetical protein
MAKDYSFMDAVEEALTSPARRASRVIGAAKGVQAAINTGAKRVLRESPVTGASRVVKAIRKVKDTYDDEVADTVSAPVESAKRYLSEDVPTASAPNDAEAARKADSDYATRRQAAIGMEVAAGDAEAARKADSDYATRRQAAIGMEVAAGDADAARKADSDYATRRQAAIGMEVAAGDADAARKADSDYATRRQAAIGMEVAAGDADANRAQSFASDMSNRSTKMDMSGVEKGMAQSKADSAYSARATAAFKKATGTSFDPKSAVDRARLKELEDVIRSNPKLADASDNKISMAWYARTKKK